MKPKQRSRLRLLAGSCYFKFNRYLKWYFGHVKFASRIENEELPYITFTHKTPLLRKLKEVDMWLQHNKIINLKIAKQKLNKITIAPGETFSYWKLIGKPTKRKGYVEGMTLFFGTFRPGVGGGLCQLSNLIYWITLHTPLVVTERHRHSYDVFPDANRTQPFGSGATCSYNYLDLQIYNPTDQPYQLVVNIDTEYLYGEWRTTAKPTHVYEIIERDHKITQEYWGGYVRSNVIYKRKYNLHKELVSEELVTKNHALMMYQPFLESPL